MIRVEGHSNLYRDERSGSIVNTDDLSYNQYLNTVNNRKKKQNEIDNIKKDIEEIKSLLKEIINGSK
jgi:hypothetical protein